MKAFYSLCLCIFFSHALFAQAETELLKKVKAKMDKVSDYLASGRMKIDVSFIDAPPSKVVVYYKKPDKVKVKKDGGIAILPKGGISVNLSSLLATTGYTVVPGKPAMMDGITVTVVKLLPADETGDIVVTTLYIDEKNLVIRKSAVTTRENGSYETALQYGKYIDWGLPDKVTFSFNTKDYKLPRGVTMEYDKGGEKKAALPKNKKGTVEITYSAYIINKGVDDRIFSK